MSIFWRAVFSVYCFSLFLNIGLIAWMDREVGERLKEYFDVPHVKKISLGAGSVRYYLAMVAVPVVNSYFSYVLMTRRDAIIETSFEANKVVMQKQLDESKDKFTEKLGEVLRKIVEEMEDE